MQIDKEFPELFDQLCCETNIGKYIDFEVTYLPAFDPLMVEWRQLTHNKCFAEVIETRDAAAKEARDSTK